MLVTLSPDGSDLLETHRDRYRAGLDALLGDLTPSERDELSRPLRRVGP